VLWGSNEDGVTRLVEHVAVGGNAWIYGDRRFVTTRHAELSPVGGFKSSHRHHTSVRRFEYDIEREIRALGQYGLPRADSIAKTLLGAAPQMSWLTLKRRA